MYRAALALGTANQLTNILRDVGEDLETRNRIYVPLDELHQVGMGHKQVCLGQLAALKPYMQCVSRLSQEPPLNVYVLIKSVITLTWSQ